MLDYTSAQLLKGNWLNGAASIHGLVPWTCWKVMHMHMRFAPSQSQLVCILHLANPCEVTTMWEGGWSAQNVATLTFQLQGFKHPSPARKGIWAALCRVCVKAGVPVAIIRHKDGASRAVGSVRAGLALPLVVPRVEAVGLLLTLSADVVVILLPWLASPGQSMLNDWSVAQCSSTMQ